MFLSELIKFRMAPPVVAFSMLLSCFKDFSGNNIEIACCLLEGCGRFLCSSKYSKGRMAKYLDTIQRLKKVRCLEPKYEMLIDNAYYHCRPPVGVSRRRVKVLTSLQLWIRHNLFERLETVGPDNVIRNLRRLPWGSTTTTTTATATDITTATAKAKATVYTENSLETPAAPQPATDVEEGFVQAQAEGVDGLKSAYHVNSISTEKKQTGLLVEQEDDKDQQAVKEIDVEMELKKYFLKVGG